MAEELPSGQAGRCFDLVLKSERVFVDGVFAPRQVAIIGDTIAGVFGPSAELQAARVHDFGAAVLMPGVVDSHVHLNEPGRTEWEGFQTATRAAAAGGITTVVDMPLNSIPPTTSMQGMRAKRAAAEGAIWVDVGLWGGVVPGNTGELAGMSKHGIAGFKCFMVPSGVPEFEHVGEADLRVALPELAALGSVLLVHAEAAGPIERAEAAVGSADPHDYTTYLRSRPPEAELDAIAAVIRLCRETGARAHIVHLACGDAVEPLRAAQAEGIEITAETCPHYLYFDAAEVARGATPYKCAPPIRDRGHQDRLRAGLVDGVIDLVVSDHSPCTPVLKQLQSGDFMGAWGGIAGLQLSLSVVWTQARRAGLPLERVITWMTEGPARLAGLSDRKGRIARGYDADFAVLAPDDSFVVDGKDLHHRHSVTPYDGHRLYGVVKATFVRGRRVFDGQQVVEEPVGALLVN